MAGAVAASSPSNRAYCYAELAVSSLAVAETVASTHFVYSWRDCQTSVGLGGLVK